MIIEFGLIISIIFGISGWAIAYKQSVDNRNTERNITKTIIERLEPLTGVKLKNIRSKGLKNILDEISQKANLEDYNFIISSPGNVEPLIINNSNLDELKRIDKSSWQWIGHFKYLIIGDFSNVNVDVIINPKSVNIMIEKFEFPYKYKDVKPDELAKKVISILKPKYKKIASDIRINFKKEHEEEND